MPSVNQTLGVPGMAPGSEVAQSFPAVLALTKPAFPSTSRGLLVAMSVISAVLVPSRMLLSTGDPDDSAVFAYMGWAMKHGLRPYRDVWDHKGPLLYYLQFAGMSLRSNSTFGIGLLEVIAFATAFFLLYSVIASFASRFISVAVAVFSVGFVTHFSSGGNMCETWALLPLAAAQYACWRWSHRMSQSWCAPIIGACFTCIFFVRPNMGMYPAIAMLVLSYQTNKTHGVGTAAKQFATACAAGLALSALIVAPLYRWGVLHEFVAAYFGYNAAYSGALSLAVRYPHTIQLLILLFATAIATLGVAGWALAINEHRRGKATAGSLPSRYLQTLLWSLPFEIAGASLSGRDYSHYLLPLFPTLVVLAAWFLSELEKQSNVVPSRPVLVAALLLGFCPFVATAYSKDFSQSTAAPRSHYLAIARFIDRATTPTDKITVVGGVDSAYITFLAHRLPASRFVYQYALIDANNPSAGEQRKQFMCDIAQNRPAVIVSGDPLLGILCATELECTLRNMQPPANDYGYKSKVLPKLLQNVIASDYRSVPDSRFGLFRVLVRNDIAIPAQW